MRPDDIFSFLRARPFRPFRLVVLERISFDIRHPELVSVGRSTILFPQSPETEGEEKTAVALLHISRIETLPRMAAPPANGA
jgi:hypothetical protein